MHFTIASQPSPQLVGISFHPNLFYIYFTTIGGYPFSILYIFHHNWWVSLSFHLDLFPPQHISTMVESHSQALATWWLCSKTTLCRKDQSTFIIADHHYHLFIDADHYHHLQIKALLQVRCVRPLFHCVWSGCHCCGK